MEIQGTDPRFQSVWDRVQGTLVPKEEDWEEFLTGKIRSELLRRGSYLALGLHHCAGLSFHRANLLRTARFFCFGIPCWPALPHNQPAKDIRTLFQEEVLSEGDYLQARDACQSDLLGAVFAQCAQDCRKARQGLWRRIEQTPEG